MQHPICILRKKDQIMNTRKSFNLIHVRHCIKGLSLFLVHKSGSQILYRLCNNNYMRLITKMWKCQDIEVTALPSRETEKDIMTTFTCLQVVNTS
jgi:hypothetical protein